MKYTALTLVAVMALPVTEISAQNANAVSGSQSQAASLSNAQGGNVAINSSEKVTYGGSYKLENTPGVSAPGIITAHQCAIGIGAGGSVPGIGLSVGGSYVDKNCELISQASALNVVAGRNAAIRHLARNPAMCVSMRAAGNISASSQCTKADKMAAAKKSKARPSARVATATTWSKNDDR